MAQPAHQAEQEYSSTGLNSRKLLMWVFLGSDCLFFGALIATYMVYRGQSLVGPYPADIIDVPITTISTFVLLCSSFSMVQALSATNRDDQKWIRIWLLATAFLGAIFIGFQIFEFNSFKNEGLTLGEVINRWRRRDAPFQRGSVPGIVAGGAPVAQGQNQVDDEEQHPNEEDYIP